SPTASPPEHTAQRNTKPLPVSGTAPPTAAPIAADPATETPRVESARGFLQRHEYAKAEEIYRSILKTDPQNREAVLALADVLYRQNRFEESAAVLKALSAQPRQ
ncbi:MAG: tetratricopeptide repeat protein, partial [Acidobacteriota bacterium]|nr:tetratricopeptide repeat protein [Acidobacteriota bacterium]